MRSRIPALLVVALLSVPVGAATRMTYDIQGSPTAISWAPAAFPLRYEIDQRVAQMNSGAVAMIDRAFAAWAAVPETDISFQSRGVVQGASTDAADRIVISVADDLFKDQGAAAITTYSYDTTTGRMLDADIRIDSSLFSGELNAQMALQHEIGHVLGLDHSAVLSSIMFPYVGPGNAAPEFDSDDRIAISQIYPKGDPSLMGATLEGRVMGDQGGIFAAQVVAVNDHGQPVGTVLTNSAGEFTLNGIPAGRYRLYTEPLDGPVEIASLQGSWRQAKLVSFPTAFFGPAIQVENGRVLRQPRGDDCRRGPAQSKMGRCHAQRLAGDEFVDRTRHREPGGDGDACRRRRRLHERHDAVRSAQSCLPARLRFLVVFELCTCDVQRAA